mmetsp:Transcript_19550/g.56926  ORF Transcript_19550/g.56926 Transcript_19550/m.56926 type:complete len:495 (+) Transcript_19550:100-1584(+)
MTDAASGKASDLVLRSPREQAASSSSAPHNTRFIKGTVIEKPPNNDVAGLSGMLNHPLNYLLLCLPLGVYGFFHGWGDVAVFFLNFIALIPLAKILGDATEELAAGLQNDMLAGLLNATFGNAVEMVMMIQTLRAGLLDVVKATLLGSVLSNLLLVLGMSFFFGGIVGGKIKPAKPATLGLLDRQGSKPGMDRQLSKLSSTLSERSHYTPVPTGAAPGAAGGALAADAPMASASNQFVMEKVQSFSILSALVNTSMLLLACLVLSLVAVFSSEAHEAGIQDDASEAAMMEIVVMVSRVCSIVMISAYIAYIFFQLVTHREAMAEEEGGDEGEATVSVGTSIAVMLAVTIIVAFSTDLLVRSLEGVVKHAHISAHFIGIILLPIVGNACEHASAVRFAIMDKPGLSIGIAIGSSTQISMFVVPFSVLAGWGMQKQADLDFGRLNTTVLCVSIVVVLSIVVDGQANWLQGYLLMSAYIIIAVLYFFLPNAIATQTD